MSGFKNFAMGVLMLILAAYGAVKASMYFHARYRVNLLLAPLARAAKVDYGDVTVSLFGPVGITDLSVVDRENGARLTVEKTVVHDFEYERRELLPRRLYITLDGVHVDGTLLREARRTPPQWIERSGFETVYRDGLNLAALGYNELLANVELDWHYDPIAGEANVRYHLDAEDMGDLELNMAVAGVAPGDLRRGMPGLSFRSASFRYEDASFVRRLMAKEAERHHQATAAYQQGLANAVETDLLNHEVALDAASVKAIKQFLVKPQRLVITMQPFNAVPMKNLRFYKAGDIPMLLNTQVSN